MDTQQNAQFAIEALQRRRLQNRIAQRNRRKRQAELEQQRQREFEKGMKESQPQQDSKAPVSSDSNSHDCQTSILNKAKNMPETPRFEQNTSVLPSLEPARSQSEVIQYGSCAAIAPEKLTWHQESFSIATLDPSSDGINIYGDIGETVPNFMHDPELRSRRYSSTPTPSSIRYSLPAPLKPTSDDPNAPHQQSRAKLWAQQQASQCQLNCNLIGKSLIEISLPTSRTNGRPTPSPTLLPGGYGGLLSGCSDDRGKTALHISAERGNVDIVRLLLQYGSNINGTDIWGRTALHYAVRGAHIDIVTQLLAGGADLEARDHEGRSALHIAADSNSEAIIRLLVQEGADLNATIDTGSGGEEGDDASKIMEAGTGGCAVKLIKPHESH